MASLRPDTRATQPEALPEKVWSDTTPLPECSYRNLIEFEAVS
jgi:hypothetical protein